MPCPANFERFLIFVMGPQGAHRSAICNRLAKHCGYQHLNVDSLMKEDYSNQIVEHEERLQEYRKTIDKNLFTTLKVAERLEYEINKHEEEGCHRFLVSGFPKYLEQGTFVEQRIGPPKFVLYFDCPPEIAQNRAKKDILTAKGDCPDSKLNFTLKFCKEQYERFHLLKDLMLSHYSAQEKLFVVDASLDENTMYAELLQRFDWKAARSNLQLSKDPHKQTSF